MRRSRPVWIAASTHSGEEQAVLDAHREILDQRPDALLIWVPRHPERFPAVAAQLERAGLPFVTRSSGAHCTAQTRVMLGDTMGELTMFYAAADVAFVARQPGAHWRPQSARARGLGVPAITGPHNFNAADIVELLVASGAVEIVRRAEQLAGAILDLLDNSAERARRAAAGTAAVAASRGALRRLLDLLEPLLLGLEAASRSSESPASR